MFDLSTIDWLTTAVCATMVGVAKTGVPGLGPLYVPMLAAVIPARASTGVLLPMLIFADIFAVSYYRRHAVWSHLLRLMPWAAVGVFVGYLAMGKITDDQLQPIIGLMILAMLAVNYWRNTRMDPEAVPTQWWFAAAFGLAAGVVTMMANVAGPIMIIYLLAMRLPKRELIGTGAWYFIIMNCFKVPFSANLGLITRQSLQLNLTLLPVIALGALAGILIAKRIPERAFAIIVQTLAAVAAVKLLI